MGYSVKERNDAIDAMLYAYEAMDQLMDEFIEAGLSAKDFNVIAPNMLRSDKSARFITEKTEEQNIFFDDARRQIPFSMYTAVGRVPLFKRRPITITDEISNAFAQHARRFMGLQRYDHSRPCFLGAPSGTYWFRCINNDGYFKNDPSEEQLLVDVEESALRRWFR